jgi:hypothetical protein
MPRVARPVGVIGQEGRAMANAGNAGLTFWAPNINIVRDRTLLMSSLVVTVHC